MPVFLPAFFLPDPTRSEPLPVQLFAALGAAIRAGRIADGAVLPSTRHAAQMLGLSRSSITTAYDLLRAEGIIEMRPGSRPRACLPTTPATDRVESITPRVSTRGQRLAHDPRKATYVTETGRLAPGLPDEHEFPASLWAQILRRQARPARGEEAGYGGYHGTQALRETLCTRLASDRGLAIRPEQILITPGTQASLSLVTQIMTDPGDVIAMEDPGYVGAKASFLAAGATLCPVPVDSDGMQVEALPPEARLIYITPSNQYPLGGRMGLARRLDLLERARSQGALIIEDDYDSEFLWHGREIAALAAHGSFTECIYLGSASKALLPGLRLGWIVVPEALIDPMRAAHRTMGCAANLHAQLALSELMESGHYRRHLRHIARLYQSRGEALYEALQNCEGVVVTRPRGGVQLGLRFVEKGFELVSQTALAQAGYRVARLSALCHAATQEGLVIGFATLRPDDPQRIASLLGQCLSAPAKA
ncbi:PLP-dependent aminotransferase family protein [Asaia siamensis]|uniref:Transcriptional regulator n=1 Tax=Asaia siamensis TaxID=110479 RepID=A0ABQ1LCR2_9PROT|nr:PLP-dependent aminotransferase family protein [Asaia siamensis]GBR08917.1 MocR family transcriptional regulator [Asaia siamensis NRIC 0323]GGC21425.1 transcriptional regulator [Asaia siamensis]